MTNQSTPIQLNVRSYADELSENDIGVVNTFQDPVQPIVESMMVTINRTKEVSDPIAALINNANIFIVLAMIRKKPRKLIALGNIVHEMLEELTAETLKEYEGGQE